jgi:hypothetical protein
MVQQSQNSHWRKAWRFVYRILSGWFNWLFQKPNEITRYRRHICSECAYNKKGICTACGCVIKAKTACKECDCIKGKW